MAGELEGKAAIVTGAAYGVGLAVARRFAEAGAHVLMTDSEEEPLEREAQALRDEGAEVHDWRCDLREKLGVANLLASAADRLGRIDVLVNAHLRIAPGDLLTVGADVFDAAYQTNIRSIFMLCQGAARRMIEQAGDEPGGGAIVNLTSIAARRTTPDLLPYSVSCAGLDQLTRSMAVALAPKRIRVNGVALGAVMTRDLKAQLKDREGLRAAMIEATPLGRIGEATEVAEAALFLASPKASFVTGQILAVDGGRTMLDPLAQPTQ